MSGVHGEILTHLVRRGVTAAQAHFAGPNPEYMRHLQQDAELYDNAGEDMTIDIKEMVPVMITGIIMMLIVASIRYTVGEVIASLTMIESPTSTAIIEDKPPAYADEPDAPLEKETLLPAEAVADVEVTLIKNKPVTAKITGTIGHLQRVGGFRARWRGIGLSVLYHFLHATATNILSHLLMRTVIPRSLIYVFVSVALARFHMLWTHSMIAYPAAKPFYRRFVSRKESRAVFLPAFVFAVAQQATILIPFGVAALVGVSLTDGETVMKVTIAKNCGELAFLTIRLLAIPVTTLVIALTLLLPAAITLTRIEALHLPADQDTIVPFDRQAIVADIDLSARGGHKALFVQAWRSVDSASRWKLVKLYVKMALIQFTVFAVGVHLMLAEVYVIGGERIALMFKSAAAQMKLEFIRAQEQASH